MPGITTCSIPVLRLLPSNALLASVLGDFRTGLGIIGLAWQSSPALTEVEEVATGWMRQMLGPSEQWSGVIQDTASTSTLVALMCARERPPLRSPAAVAGGAAPLVVHAPPRTVTVLSRSGVAGRLPAAIMSAWCRTIRRSRCARTRSMP